MEDKNFDPAYENNGQNDDFKSPTRLDDWVARSTQIVSQQTLSRRSFLNVVGKFLLAITGATLIHALPIDREELIASADASNCQDWYMCGIYTPRVCLCTSGSNSCPCGLPLGNNPWNACCPTGSGSWFRVYYYDCCCPYYGCTNCSCCSSCSGNCGCIRFPGTQLWCGGVSNAKLCCTRYVITGSC